MKTYVFGLVFLGVTNLMIAQNEVAAVNHATTNYNATAHANTTVSAIKNADYLTNIDFKDIAQRIKLLHQKAANYDIKEAKVYTPERPATYNVVFTEGANQIKAVYNHEGTIVSCDESYEDVRLPYAISSQIAKDYPGWEFNATSCTISYAKEDVSKVNYKIELKKGNKTRIIKIAQ